MTNSDGRSFFKRSSWFWIITVTISMGYYTYICPTCPQTQLGYRGKSGTVGDGLLYTQCRHLKWVVFWSESVPCDRLGPLGSLTKHLVDNHSSLLYNGWWLAWAVHLAEAIVAMKLCSDKGVRSTKARCLWFVQTFLFGFASLGLLIKYKPDRISKQK